MLLIISISVGDGPADSIKDSSVLLGTIPQETGVIEYELTYLFIYTIIRSYGFVKLLVGHLHFIHVMV